MNKAKIIFECLQNIGVQVSVVGNTLRLEADQGTITNDMRENVKKNKSEIISLIKQKYSCEKSEESEERGGHTAEKELISLNSLSSQEENITITAQGYGCVCGHNLYHYQPGKLWQCENCKTIYEIIGGSRGPKYIN
jgi:ribosomal protein L37AE/L43A